MCAPLNTLTEHFSRCHPAVMLPCACTLHTSAVCTPSSKLLPGQYNDLHFSLHKMVGCRTDPATASKPEAAELVCSPRNFDAQQFTRTTDGTFFALRFQNRERRNLSAHRATSTQQFARSADGTFFALRFQNQERRNLSAHRATSTQQFAHSADGTFFALHFQNRGAAEHFSRYAFKTRSDGTCLLTAQIRDDNLRALPTEHFSRRAFKTGGR